MPVGILFLFGRMIRNLKGFAIATIKNHSSFKNITVMTVNCIYGLFNITTVTAVQMIMNVAYMMLVI